METKVKEINIFIVDKLLFSCRKQIIKIYGLLFEKMAFFGFD